jgi:nucleoside phosphorylase
MNLFQGESIPQARALVVTALPVEFEAVRMHLDEPREFVMPLGMVGEVGIFDAYSVQWRVGIIQTGMGNERSAVETERAVRDFDPETVLFVGIAGGIKDVALGDVVVASKVYAYEYGKEAESFRPRPEALEPSYRSCQRAIAVARNDAWRLRIRLPGSVSLTESPSAVVKPMVAGSKVVSDTRSETARLLRASFSDAAAVEMEGHGFLRALQAHPARQALIVRGISDLLDGKEDTDARGWQSIASATAAAFAFEVLATMAPLNAEKSGGLDSAIAGAGEEVFWKALYALFVRLYPSGPVQERIWERAGGDLSRIPAATTPRTAWYDAVKLLQHGGGGTSISATSLLRAAQEDSPHNPEVARLMRGDGVR